MRTRCARKTTTRSSACSSRLVVRSNDRQQPSRAQPGEPVMFTASELAERFGLALQGDGAVQVRGVGTLAGGGADQLAFLANPKYRRQLAQTRAGVVGMGGGRRDGVN